MAALVSTRSAWVASTLVLAVLACSGTAAAQDTFVRTEGTAFTVGGAPFAFVGANIAVMHGPVHRASMEASLDAVVADGVRVVRVWALGEYDSAAPEWADLYAFRRGSELFVDGALAHLDRVLIACAARELRVIVVLANRWGDYGGLPQYLRWADVAFPASDGGLAELALPLFFASIRARSLYLAHIERVVARTNAVSGVAYRDDPTIFAWELWNEISSPPRARGDLVALLEESAQRIRAIDPNHLVSAGHIGYQLERDRRTWQAAIGARGIDYADAHAYPTRYGHVRSLRALDRWVADRARVAREASRPLIFGEVGFHRRPFDIPRARWLDRFFSAARAHGASGVLPWIYAPSGDHPREYTIYFDGDAPSTDLRRVITREARRIAGLDPRTAPMPEERSMERTLIGSGRVHTRWTQQDAGEELLSIAPESFHRARFEAAGRAEGPRSAHVYGLGTGWVRYRFATPPNARSATRITLRFRASSELPGPGLGAVESDTSEMVIRIDDIEVGRARLPVDDGFGALVEITSDDAALLRALRHGTHTLELAIDEDDAPGLCIYGEPADPAAETGLSSIDVVTSAR
jgi:mannan endo-1,4-beta-mannosidase